MGYKIKAKSDDDYRVISTFLESKQDIQIIVANDKRRLLGISSISPETASLVRELGGSVEADAEYSLK